MVTVNMINNKYDDFLLRLKEERKRLGLQQKELAEKMGTSENTQVRYESGRTSPDIEYVMGLQSHGFDVAYLMTGVRSVPSELSNKTQEGEVLLLFKQLTAEKQQLIHSLLRML